jgi:hypothetical protein
MTPLQRFSKVSRKKGKMTSPVLPRTSGSKENLNSEVAFYEDDILPLLAFCALLP